MVAHLLEGIDKLRRAAVAKQAMNVGGDLLDVALIDGAIDKADFLRQYLVEDQAADGGVDNFAINAHLDRLV